MILRRARLLHEGVRQGRDFAPNAFCQYLSNQLQVLWRQTLATVMLQRDPYLIKPAELRFAQGATFTGHAQHFPAESNGAGLWLLAVVLPINIDDLFGNVGVQQRGE